MYNAHHGHDDGDVHVPHGHGDDVHAHGHDNHMYNAHHGHDDVQPQPSALLQNPLLFLWSLKSVFHQAHPKEL